MNPNPFPPSPPCPFTAIIATCSESHTKVIFNEAVTGRTAAEPIYAKADASKLYMALTTWKHAPHGENLKSDVTVAKNYLSETHVKELNRIVSAYLDLAENRAQRGIVTRMADWAKFLKDFIHSEDAGSDCRFLGAFVFPDEAWLSGPVSDRR